MIQSGNLLRVLCCLFVAGLLFTVGSVGATDTGQVPSQSDGNATGIESTAAPVDSPDVPDADAYVGVEGACMDPCWNSLQEALDFVSEGDTLFLMHGGVFEEQVTVTDDDVTIRGDPDWDTGAFWQPESTPSDEPVLRINADNVSVEQIGIDRAGHPDRHSASPSAAAIEVEGKNVSFSDVEVNAYVREWDDTRIRSGPGDHVTFAPEEAPPSEGLEGIALDTEVGTAALSDVDLTGFDTGLSVGAGTNAVITATTFTNNTVGTAFVDDASGTITDSAFINNTAFGVLAETETVEATKNWWSDESGPGGIGSGTGDDVTENVIYEPWADLPPVGIETTATPLAVHVDELPQPVTLEATAEGTEKISIENIREEWTVTGVETDSELAAEPFDAYESGDTEFSAEFASVDNHELAIELEVDLERTDPVPTNRQDLTLSVIGGDGTTVSEERSISLAETALDVAVETDGPDAWITVQGNDADDFVVGTDVDDTTLGGLPAGTNVTSVTYPSLVGEPLERYESGEPLTLPLAFRGTHFIDIGISTTDETNVSAPNETITVEAGVDGVTTATTSVALGDNALDSYTNDDGVITTDGLREAISDWRSEQIETTELRQVIEHWRSEEPIA